MGPATAKNDQLLSGNELCCPSSPVVALPEDPSTGTDQCDITLEPDTASSIATPPSGANDNYINVSDDDEASWKGEDESHSLREEEREDEESPDGGWGWAVLGGVMLVNFTHIGHFKSVAVYVEPLMRQFEASPSRVAWIVSFLFCGFSFSAPIASMLAQRIGPRALSLSASVVACASLALSSLATSLEFLYVTLGLMAGIAAVCSFNPGVLMIARYFVKHRGLANGLCMAGNALGGILLPLVTEMLISFYGFRGGILVMGGLLLNGCVGAMLWQPVSWHLKKRPRPGHSELRVSDSGIDTCCDYEPSQTAEDATTATSSPNEGPSLAFEEEEIPWIENSAAPLSRTMSTSLSGRSPFRGRRYRADSITSQSSKCYKLLTAGSNGMPRLDESVARSKLSRSTDSVTSSLKYLSTCDLSPAASAAVAALAKLPVEEEEEESVRKADVEVGETTPIRGRTPSSEKSNNKKKKKEKKKLVLMDRALLRNPVFWIIAFSQICWVFGYPGTQLFLPLRATLLGYSQQQAASLLSALALADFFGRIFCAWLSDFQFCSRLYWCIGGMFFSGVFALVLPLATDYFSLVALAIGFGFSAGAYLGLIVARFADIFGGEKVSMVHGMVCVFSGISGVGGPPLLGYILQRTQSYVLCQCILATVLMIGSVVCLLEPWAARRQALCLTGVAADHQTKDDDAPVE